MRKYVLLVFAIMLSCVNVLLAQTIWENSACLYQSNNAKILLREEISTGTILFYSIDNQIFLNKFNDEGDPTLDEALSLGNGDNFEKVFKAIKCDDDNYLIGWREANNLKVQKFDEDGAEEWENPIVISIPDYADYVINESALMVTETQINLAINYSYDEETENIIHYQIDFSTGTPQISTPVVIYEGDYIRSLNGLSTPESTTLMWVIPNVNMLSIYKDGVIYQTPTFYSDWSDTYKGDLPRSDTGKIIELNETTTVFALNSAGPFTVHYKNSGLFIFSEVDSTLTNISLEGDVSLIGIYKLSNDQFLAVTMTCSLTKNTNFTKYDELGNVISTTAVANPFDSWFDGVASMVYDRIKSVDAVLNGNIFRIAMASIRLLGNNLDNRSNLSVITYNTDLEIYTATNATLVDSQLSRYSAEYILTTPTAISLLHNFDYGTYHAYKQYTYPWTDLEEIEPVVSSYEFCKNYYSKINNIHSFSQQGSNRVIMNYQSEDNDVWSSTLLEAELDESGELQSSTTVLPSNACLRNFKVHDVSQNSGLLHYTYWKNHSVHQKANLYKENGSISIYSLVNGHSSILPFPSFLNVNNGNGWFSYIGSDSVYKLNKIENNILEESPVSDLDLSNFLAFEGNYLIFSPNGNMRLMELDDSGAVSSDWDPEGLGFYTSLDYNNEEIEVNTYQNKLVVSYLTEESYQVVVINPEDLDAYANYTIPADYNASYQEFVIGSKFYYINNGNDSLTLTCYDIANNFSQVWQTTIADNINNEFSIKKLDNRFAIAYSQGAEGDERVYLRTISFLGNSDQFENGYVLPLNLERQYSPTISVVADNTIYVNRIENSSADNPGVYSDLIDLSYFVPNSSEDVPALTFSATNYPNPFNPETTISYNLPKAGITKVEVFNLRGQLVKTLVNEVQTEGNQKVIWKGNNNQDKQVASGIYLYKIKTTGDVISGKMVLMK